MWGVRLDGPGPLFGLYGGIEGIEDTAECLLLSSSMLQYLGILVFYGVVWRGLRGVGFCRGSGILKWD